MVLYKIGDNQQRFKMKRDVTEPTQISVSRNNSENGQEFNVGIQRDQAAQNIYKYQMAYRVAPGSKSLFDSQGKSVGSDAVKQMNIIDSNEDYKKLISNEVEKLEEVNFYLREQGKLYRVNQFG